MTNENTQKHSRTTCSPKSQITEKRNSLKIAARRVETTKEIGRKLLLRLPSSF
jgi:hypothetical protein